MQQALPFGDMLRKRRLAAGLTQEGLAAKSGLSPRAITDLERNVVQVPRRDTVAMLADALNLDPEERERWEQLRSRRSTRKSLHDMTPPARTVLPSSPNPLIGREDDVRQLARMLQQSDVRLATVLGPGGVGKTRVALEAGRRLEHAFLDGVVFVDLSPIRDSRLAVRAVADRLGLRIAGGEDVVARLAEYLERRSLLLILDNFEHLLAAASDVARLISENGSLKILATSRARLHVQSESTFPITSLRLPPTSKHISSEDAVQYPSVELFVQRARQVAPDFSFNDESVPDIVAICRRLDGLPLAIELAAARTRVLGPAEMRSLLEDRLTLLASGFRDGPDRHRTMRDAIAWSYDLLSEEEQRLFRRLAIFVGGWTRAAAEATSPAGVDTLIGLEALLDSSLIYWTNRESDEPRLGMLETIREFGLNRLEQLGELDDARAAHADYVLALAMEAEPHLRGPDPARWLDRMEAEMGNFRVALEWSLWEDVDPEIGLRLVAGLSWYWFRLRGDIAEGRQWLSRMLERSPGASRSRMKALAGAAYLAHMQRDIGSTRDHARESLALARELSDEWYTVWSLHLLSRAAYFDHDASTAREYGLQALDLADEVGDPWLDAWIYQSLGANSLAAGDLAHARASLESSLETWEQIGDRPGIAAVLALLGVVAGREGDPHGSLTLLKRSLSIYRELGTRWFIANFIAEVVALAVRLNEPRRAAGLCGFVDEEWETVGAGPAPFTEVNYRQGRALIRESLTAAEFDDCWNSGAAMTFEQAIDEALRVGRAG